MNIGTVVASTCDSVGIILLLLVLLFVASSPAIFRIYISVHLPCAAGIVLNGLVR